MNFRTEGLKRVARGNYRPPGQAPWEGLQLPARPDIRPTSQVCQTETLVILKAVGLVRPEVTAMLFGTPQSFGCRSAPLLLFALSVQRSSEDSFSGHAIVAILITVGCP